MTTAISVVEGAVSQAMATYSQSVAAHNYALVPQDQQIAAMMQLKKSKFIFDTASRNPLSVQESMVTAGHLGLDLTAGKRQGWLVPRKGKAINDRGQEVETFGIVLQVGYKGVEAIHQRLGIIKRLSISLIHENDRFMWNGDDTEKPTLEANWNGDRGAVVGVYSVTYFPDGDIQVIQTPLSTIYEKHRDKSDSWKNEKGRKYSPWMTSAEEMIKKTQAFIASKQWPALASSADSSPVLTKLFEADTADHTFEQEEAYTPSCTVMQTLMVCGDSLGVYLLSEQFKARMLEEDEMQVAFELKSSVTNGLADKTKGAAWLSYERTVDKGRALIDKITIAANESDPEGVANCFCYAIGLTKQMLRAQQPELYELIVPLMKEHKEQDTLKLAAQRKAQDEAN